MEFQAQGWAFACLLYNGHKKSISEIVMQL